MYYILPVICHFLWKHYYTWIEGFEIWLHTYLKVAICQELTMIISSNTMDSCVKPGTGYYTSDEDIEENLRCIFPLAFAFGIVDIQFSITDVNSGNKYFSEILIIYRFITCKTCLKYMNSFIRFSQCAIEIFG